MAASSAELQYPSHPSSSSSLQSEVSAVSVLVSPRLDQVLAIENEAFPPCERLGPILLQQQATLRTSGLLLAELGATVTGFLLFTRIGHTGLITKLAVSGAFRRCGIASSLMRRGIEELERPQRRTRLAEIELHVDPSRTEAQHLYENFGFSKVARLPNYYQDARDAILMRRCSPPPPPSVS